MKYTELQKNIQNRINECPLYFAFGDSQLEEVMKKNNIKSVDELTSIGYGGIIKKVDIEKYKSMNSDIAKMKEEFMKDDKQLLNAMIYELNNHEYTYSYEVEEALEALSLDINKLTTREKKILEEAKTICIANDE